MQDGVGRGGRKMSVGGVLGCSAMRVRERSDGTGQDGDKGAAQDRAESKQAQDEQLWRARRCEMGSGGAGWRAMARDRRE